MSCCMLRALVAALLLGASARTAAAADAEWYGEFHVGTTRSDHTNAAITGDEKTEGAYGVGVGVRYNDHFSVQLDWHTLGENPDQPACPGVCVTTIPLPEHGWSIRALPRLPLGDRFALELGLGLMSWEGDYNFAGAPAMSVGTDGWYSLGVEWRFAERWAVTLEAQQLDSDLVELEWAGAALRYRF